MAAFVKSALRTLDLLELLAASKNGLLLSDMSRVLNIPISSTHTLIATLEYRNYLVRNQSSLLYHIGPKFIQLVASGNTIVDLTTLASGTLDRIQSECQEAVTLSVLQSDKIVFISNRSSSSIVQIVNKIGTTLPAHATASGKILLANLPPDEVDRIYPKPNLPQITERTIRTKDELKLALTKSKTQGFAYDEGESEEGVWAVASCVKSSIGISQAAVSIVVPQIRVSKVMIQKWAEMIMDAALEISLKLGFTPD